jgi:hypothetical protein
MKFHRQYIDVNKLPPQVVEKWSPSVLDEGFVPCPKKLVRCLHKLFTNAEAVQDLAAILAIVDFKRPNLTRMPSMEYLSFLAGLEVDQFKAALDRLEQKGYIRVTSERDGIAVSLDGLLKEIENQTGGNAT